MMKEIMKLKPDRMGRFSVRSSYVMKSQRGGKITANLWIIITPPQMNFVYGRNGMKKMMTLENVKRKGYELQVGVLYQMKRKSSNHLFALKGKDCFC